MSTYVIQDTTSVPRPFAGKFCGLRIFGFLDFGLLSVYYPLLFGFLVFFLLAISKF